MSIEEKKQRIIALWHAIEKGIKPSLALLWERREELEELRVDAATLEDEVIRILERIPSLRRDSNEYHEHTRNFIRLIRHIEPSEEWVNRVKMDLDHIVGEINKIEEAVKRR